MNTRRAILALAILFCLVLPWLLARADGGGGVYAMNAFGGQVPDGAVGATLFAPWGDLNPAQNVYTWGSLDAQIAMHALGGRPVSLMVTVSRSGWYGDNIYVDDTPGWVGASRSVPIAGKTLRLPAYDDARWKVAVQALVTALGKRYDGDARISSVTIGLGLDGETHAYKSDYETYVAAALGVGYKPAFERYCKEAIVWYDRAFPATPLYVAANPGGQAFRRELIRNYLLPLSIGYKNAGLQIDDPTAWGPATYEGQGGNYALYAPMRDLAGRVPLWLESTTGTNATAESVYWSLLLGMSWRPTGIDLHKEWFAANPQAIAWTNGYLAEPEHGAWIVLRDREYAPYSASIPITSSMYLSGWPGDFERGITRTSDAARVLRASLPLECRDQVESRQARTFTGGMTLQVGTHIRASLTQLTVRVCYLDRGAGFAVTIAGQRRVLGGGGTRRFVWREWPVVVGADWDGVVYCEGEGTLHMVEITRAGAGPDVVTPTPTFSPTVTVTPSAWPTYTRTPMPPTVTPTVTPTRRACWEPLPLTWAERMGIRDTAALRLYNLEDALDWQGDATLIRGGDEGLGAPLSAAFDWGPRGYQCRAFCSGVIVVDGADECEGCRNWCVVEYSGEARVD